VDQHANMEDHVGSSARVDRPAGHGMLVLGLETVFFYHLPMFMAPHDYQAIFEGSFSHAGSDPQRTYKEDRKSHPETPVYTFAPDPFVLPELFTPEPKRKSIRGDLFRGHFEKPPEYPEKPAQIGAGIDVNVTNVVFVQQLLPLPTPLDGLEYVLFGKGKDLFLAHLLTREGDFDQVVSAEIQGHQFADDELRHGVRVRFNGKANTVSQRLVERTAVSGTANVADEKPAIEVVLTREFYMSERDLA